MGLSLAWGLQAQCRRETGTVRQFGGALAEEPSRGTAATGPFIYPSRSEMASGGSRLLLSPLPSHAALPSACTAPRVREGQPHAGIPPTHTHTPPRCPGKGFKQRGVRLHLLHLLPLGRSRMDVRRVSRLSLCQRLTRRTSAYAPSLYIPAVNSESHLRYPSIATVGGFAL